MPFVEHSGAKIYWDQAGAGPPVLMIMGLSFTHEMWFRILPALSSSFRTIFFDNRGMGRSSTPRGPYRISQMAHDAAAVMDAAGVPSAHIIGASMGGMIAQELALRYPHRVLSLLLGCTSYSGLFARWPERRYRPRNISMRKSSRAEREAAFIPLLYSDTTPRERIAEDLDVRSDLRVDLPRIPEPVRRDSDVEFVPAIAADCGADFGGAWRSGSPDTGGERTSCGEAHSGSEV